MGKGKRIRTQKAIEKNREIELLQAEQRGYEKGYRDLIEYTIEKLSTLNEIEGVGPKLEKKIIKHFVKESLTGDSELEFESLFKK